MSKVAAILIGVMLVFSCTEPILAGEKAKGSSGTLGKEAVYYPDWETLDVRIITEYDLDLQKGPSELFESEKFFDALKSDSISAQYIAIHRLMESYNDKTLKKKAIKEITPFLKSKEPKLKEAAAFVLDILTETFSSDFVYKLWDGGYLIQMLPNYSDSYGYGSYPKLLRIKDSVLENGTSFAEPMFYIQDVILSPNAEKAAILLGSNKSSFIVIWDVRNGYSSPELISTSRNNYGATKGYNLMQRSDWENYCGFSNAAWTSNDTFVFHAALTYNYLEIVEKVKVKYHFSDQKFEFNIKK